MHREHAQRYRWESRQRGVGGAGEPHLPGQEDSAPLRRGQDLDRRRSTQGLSIGRPICEGAWRRA